MIDLQNEWRRSYRRGECAFLKFSPDGWTGGAGKCVGIERSDLGEFLSLY